MPTTSLESDAALTATLRELMPLAEHNQIVSISGDTDRVVMAAEWQPRFCGVGGVLHGGFLMALADGAGATLAFLNLEAGQRTTTVESKTNFFRPVLSGTVTATATMVHKGRTTIVAQTDITNDQGALVARVTQTQAVRAA